MVPLAAQSIDASGAGIWPPAPSTRISPLFQSAVSRMPSDARPAAITRVSWLSSAPERRLVPRASAEQTRARLVMLFDPGGRIEPWTGPGHSGISMAAVMMTGPLRGWSPSGKVKAG